MRELWGKDLEVVIHVIQIALAPAFLLVAVTGLLTVVTGRLARAIDRARDVLGLLGHAVPAEKPRLLAELKLLLRRKRLMRRSVQLAVASGVMTCAVVTLLFVMGLVKFSAATLIVTMFAIAMALMAAALVLLLVEASLASHEAAMDELAAISESDARSG